MEREALGDLLTDGTEAATAARDAGLRGGAYVVRDGSDGSTSAESLARVYERRLRHTRRIGVSARRRRTWSARYDVSAATPPRCASAGSTRPTGRGSTCCSSTRTASPSSPARASNSRNDEHPRRCHLRFLRAFALRSASLRLWTV